MAKFKSKKKKRKLKIYFFLIMIIIGIISSYHYLERSNLTISNRDYINLIINSTFSNDNKLLEKIFSRTIDKTNPIRQMNKTYTKYLENKNIDVMKDSLPIIYLYNTHPTEGYKSSTYAEFSVNPTVIMNNYILEDIFNKSGYKTIVEEESVSKILSDNKWKYYNSYKASRILLDKSIINYPSLKYFIDIHRDSLPRSKTTIDINGKSYAKILFIVGMENKNYQKNLEFTEKINNKINMYYPNLSKGIYKKGGEGVNGVYNQDFNPNTILIEIGGEENTTSEVLNSALAFSKCFMEVINEQNT